MLTRIQMPTNETFLVDVPCGATVARLRELLREHGVANAHSFRSFTVNGRAVSGDNDRVLPNGAERVDTSTSPGEMCAAMQQIARETDVTQGPLGLAGPVHITVSE
jgi:hypothetical protein